MAPKRVKKHPKRSLKMTGRRGLSLFLSLVMMISLVQIGAFAAAPSAAEEQEKAQIMEGYYTPDDENKVLTDQITKDAWNTSEGGNVKVSKTIAATGTENLFEVALEVQTSQKLSETITTPDAAIMLVMDRSGSMSYCAECGHDSIDSDTKYYCHGTGGDEYWDPPFDWSSNCGSCGKPLSAHNAVTTEDCTHDGGYWTSDGWEYCDCASTQSRMTAAKAGAISFLDQLLEDTPKNSDGSYAAHRYISLASFAADTDLDCDWVDITTTDGYNQVVNAINGLSANGGTYLQGGLKWAVRQMQRTNAMDGAVDITKISNRYTVVLTDGEPTYSDNYGNGTSCSAKICQETAQTANSLLQLSSVYSICYGADSETCYTYKRGNDPFDQNKDRKVTVGEFLRGISTAYYSADNIDDLDTAFGNISDIIALLTEAWKVTDPMGQNILFQRVTSNQGTTVSFDNNTLTWDLKGDVPVDVQTDKDKTTYTYKLTYEVILNNVGTDFKSGECYPTNGYTYLTYVFYNENGQLVDENGNVLEDVEDPFSISFNVPAVKGYQADLDFTKIASDTKDALLGAKFTLAESSGKLAAREDTSDADGKVGFSNIPSGYTYTLTETSAPIGYNPIDPITFTVKYGEIYKGSDKIENGHLGDIEDPSKQTYINVTITKTWMKPADQATADSITVTLLQDGTEYKTVTLTAEDCTVSGNTWTYVFENLPEFAPDGDSYVYTVKEAEMDGWTVTYSEDGRTITNTASGKTFVIVDKEWILPEDMDADSASVSVTLTQNGTVMTDSKYTQTIYGNSSVIFNDLKKYDENGQLYVYDVVETGSSYTPVSRMLIPLRDIPTSL